MSLDRGIAIMQAACAAVQILFARDSRFGVFVKHQSENGFLPEDGEEQDRFFRSMAVESI